MSGRLSTAPVRVDHPGADDVTQSYDHIDRSRRAIGTIHARARTTPLTAGIRSNVSICGSKDIAPIGARLTLPGVRFPPAERLNQRMRFSYVRFMTQVRKAEAR